MNTKINKSAKKKYSRKFNIHMPLKLPVDTGKLAQEALIEISTENNEDADVIYNYSHEFSYSPKLKLNKEKSKSVTNKSIDKIQNYELIVGKFQKECMSSQDNQILYKTIKEKMSNSATFKSQTDYLTEKRKRELSMYQNLEKVPLSSTEFVILDPINQKQRKKNPFKIKTARSIKYITLSNSQNKNQEKSNNKLSQTLKKQSKQRDHLDQSSNHFYIQGSKFQLGFDEILSKNYLLYNKMRQHFIFKNCSSIPPPFKSLSTCSKQ